LLESTFSEKEQLNFDSV